MDLNRLFLGFMVSGGMIHPTFHGANVIMFVNPQTSVPGFVIKYYSSIIWKVLSNPPQVFDSFDASTRGG